MTRREEMDSLGERLAEYGAHLDAAMHRFLADLRRFDDGGGWAQQSAQSCAHWLSWRLGMDPSTAREHLRVAHRLAELPMVDDALRRGAISYSKVRAITRVAGEATEAVLVGMAEHMTAMQLETVCRKLRTTQRKPVDPNDVSELRYLTRRDREDGMTQVTARLFPEEAARLFSVLDAIAAERTREATEELSRPADGVRGDASPAEAEAPVEDASPAEAEASVEDAWTQDGSGNLGDEAEHDSAGGPRVEMSGERARNVSAETSRAEAAPDRGGSRGTQVPMAGDAAPDGSAEAPAGKGTPSRRLRGHRFDRCDALMELVERQARGGQVDRAPIELVVTVSAAALTVDPATDPLDRAGVTSDGTCLTIPEVQRLACDAGVVILVEDEHGSPLSVGRKYRTVTTALKRALARRDPHCQFPGCTNSVFLEAHHLRHWIDGGKTEIGNMINLCTLHHAWQHEHRFTIEPGSPPRFFDERGLPIQHAPSRPQPVDLGWSAIRDANAHLGIHEDTNAPRWDGDDIDYEAAIAELCRLEDLLHAPDEWTILGATDGSGDGVSAETSAA